MKAVTRSMVAVAIAGALATGGAAAQISNNTIKIGVAFQEMDNPWHYLRFPGNPARVACGSHRPGSRAVIGAVA